MKKNAIIAFGAHPDDVEIGCGGTLFKESSSSNIVIVDLTMGECGSNGNAIIRVSESRRAADIIGAKRINLGLSDRNIVADMTSRMKVASVIRKEKPDIILIPYFKDRHPDHEASSKLIRESIFDAGCSGIDIAGLEHHKAKKTIFYYINEVENPNIFIDISLYTEQKRALLECHKSQFIKSVGSRDTTLNTGFIEKIETRDLYFGSMSGVRAAEAFHKEGYNAGDSLFDYY